MNATFWSRGSATSTEPTPSPLSAAAPSPPPLALPPATRESLEQLAGAALQDAMLRYHTYREQMRRAVSGDQWRQVKRVANLVAYKERPAWRRREAQQQQLIHSMAAPWSLGASKGPRREADSPNVLVVGALQGALDDEMYGAFVGSDRAARLRSSYVDDGLQGFEWLATLRTPTRDDPFRSCGVARAVVVGGVGRRELCFVVSMGLTRSARGERVGYYVLQSVDAHCAGLAAGLAAAASAPDRSSWRPRRHLVRASTSMVWLKCELREPAPRLELFAHGSLAPRGSGFGLAGMALRAALSLAMTSDVAYAKKLHWMMHDALGVARRRLTATDGDCMGQCKAAFGASSKSLGRCVICRATVCRACRIDRRVTVDVSAAGAQQMRCGVCVLCMTRAQTASAAPFVARESVLPRPPPPPPQSPSPPPMTRRRRATATSAPARTSPSRLTVPSLAVL